jgi:glutaredoxin
MTMCGKRRMMMTMCLMLFFTVIFWLSWPRVSNAEDNDDNVRWVRVPEGKPVGQEQATAGKRKVQNEPPPGATIDGQPIPRRVTKEVNKQQRTYADIKVGLYKTEWCPYCKQAREYINSLGVTLVEYDVEQDKTKAEEMHSKGGNGVPLIDVEGIIIRGFSAKAIKAAVEKKKNGA